MNSFLLNLIEFCQFWENFMASFPYPVLTQEFEEEFLDKSITVTCKKDLT